MKNICRLFIFSFVVLLTACSVAPHKNFDKHAIFIDGDANIVSLNDSPDPKPKTESTATEFAQSKTKSCEDSNKETLSRFYNMFDAAKRSETNKLLIFVHGGLNLQRTSTERANKLIERYESKSMESYYPMLINWDSGLWQSYWSHLVNLRQGEKQPFFGAVTSPAYLLADIGRTVVRAPIAMGYTAYRDVQAIPFVRDEFSQSKKNVDALYPEIKKREKEKYLGNISLGSELGLGRQTLYKTPINMATFIPQLIAAPFVDAFGSSSWESMQHRVKILFNRPEKLNIQGNKDAAKCVVEDGLSSAMDAFAHQLIDYQNEHKEVQITLVGHSMGTIVLNELIRKYPQIHYENIVYMAGADSIRNTFDSVFPYMRMKEHLDTKFYSLTLHPQSEIEESNFLGIAPRGSLLVWIDDFFSRPHTKLDNTVGRWDNLVQAFPAIPDEKHTSDANLKPSQKLKNRIFMKAFDQDSSIQKHGDFSRAEFWDEQFWKPGISSSNPWPIDPHKGFYSE